MHEEKEIISRVLNGDLYAFKILVQRYEKLVLYMVSKLIKDKEDAEDVCQEVFIKIYRNLGKFRHESKLSTWIAHIAYSTTINYLRKHYKRKGKGQELVSIEHIFQAEENPEQTLSKKDIHAYLNRLIEKLPDQYRTVLTLYHINEFSYQEIEEITGMPEGTVKSYLFRARKLLKDKLAVYLKDELV